MSVVYLPIHPLSLQWCSGARESASGSHSLSVRACHVVVSKLYEFLFSFHLNPLSCVPKIFSSLLGDSQWLLDKVLWHWWSCQRHGSERSFHSYDQVWLGIWQLLWKALCSLNTFHIYGKTPCTILWGELRIVWTLFLLLLFKLIFVFHICVILLCSCLILVWNRHFFLHTWRLLSQRSWADFLL